MNLIYVFQIRWPPTRHALLVLTFLFAVYSFVICLVRDQNNKYRFKIIFFNNGSDYPVNIHIVLAGISVKDNIISKFVQKILTLVINI
jgi:hypothetical protein